MKDLALIILSIAIAGALRPDEPTTASPVATPTQEAVHPAADDDGSGGLSQVTETLPSESLVKDSLERKRPLEAVGAAGTAPTAIETNPEGFFAADSIAARAVESVETHVTSTTYPERRPAVGVRVAPYTDRPTFTRYAACANGRCAVNAAPIRRRLFGRFRR